MSRRGRGFSFSIGDGPGPIAGPKIIPGATRRVGEDEETSAEIHQGRGVAENRSEDHEALVSTGGPGRLSDTAVVGTREVAVTFTSQTYRSSSSRLI